MCKVKESIAKLVAAALYTTIIFGSWALLALASGVFVGIARKGYDWVV